MIYGQQIIGNFGNVKITYSLTESGFSGTGNIISNPYFVDVKNNNFRLQNYSQAIGSGTSNGAPAFDLDGNIRPNPSGSNPDMGAFENILGVPSNAPPQISPIKDTTLSENADSVIINLSGINDGDLSSNQSINISAISSDTLLINNPVINYVSGDSTGVLKFKPNFDKYGVDTITVKLKDNGGTENGGVDTTWLIFKVNVTHVNQPPTNIILSDSSVIEHAAIGTEVGILSSVDPDTNDTHTYTLVSGDGDTNNASLTISGDKLLTNEVFDYKTKSSYSVRIQTKDSGGLTFSKSFGITINRANDLVIEDTVLVHPYCTADTTGSIEYQVTGFVPLLSFLWSTGDTTQNLHNLTAGTYTVKITDGDSNILTHEFNLNPKPIFEGTQICYITSTDSSNVIHLDKGVGNYNVGKYKIYREGTSSGEFDEIGEINAGQTAYIDSVNTRARSYTYEVSIVDQCGNESALSSNQSTMHLSVNSGTNNDVNLIWSQYIGLSVPSYSIYRNEDGGNYGLLAQLPSDITAYTDSPSDPNTRYRYYVSFDFGNACDSIANLKSGNIVEIKSNTVSTDETTGISNNFENQIKVYPNPVINNQFHIDAQINNPLQLRLIDINGRIILQKKIIQNSTQIILNNTPNGVYLLLLMDKNSIIYQHEIIKQ